MSNTKNTSLDITAFDAVKDSEAGHDFELKQPDGITGTGVIVTIVGKHADAVVAYHRNILNKMMRDEQQARRRGKANEVDIQKLNDQSREDAALRVIGWKNVQQEFSRDLLKTVFIRNPHWVDQIIEESNDLGNFTKSA